MVQYKKYDTKGEADMERIKKNFGFGFMRLPMQDGEVDIAETNRMVDAFPVSYTHLPAM